MKRRLPRSAAVPALAALAGCGASDPASISNGRPDPEGIDGGSASRPPDAADAGAETGPAPGGYRCAWPVRADKETLNVAYPDTGATYWAINYDLAPGEHIELRGELPSARYMSFVTYEPQGSPLDVLTDRDIVADENSSNPFSGEPSAPGDERRYTVVIAADADAITEPNVLAARSDDEPAGEVPDLVEPHERDEPWAIRLGSGGADAVSGTVLYRVYVPDDPKDATGGVGLPSVTLVRDTRDRQEVPTCETPGGSPAAVRRIERYGPETDIPPPEEPYFRRPDTGGNLFPLPDNVYVATIVTYEPGRIVIVGGKAPTVPDPREGKPIGSGEQLRYWSLCTNEYRKPYPVSFCALDRDVVLDEDHRYTFVISTPEDRPENATAEHGVTWLEWGSTDVHNLLLLRHMLASEDFPESATHLVPGDLALSTMGEYAPLGVYCKKSVFEQSLEALRRGEADCGG